MRKVASAAKIHWTLSTVAVITDTTALLCVFRWAVWCVCGLDVFLHIQTKEIDSFEKWKRRNVPYKHCSISLLWTFLLFSWPLSSPDV